MKIFLFIFLIWTLLSIILSCITLLIEEVVWKQTLLWWFIKKMIKNIKLWFSWLRLSVIWTYKYGASYWYNVDNYKWITYWIYIFQGWNIKYWYELSDSNWDVIDSHNQKRVSHKQIGEYIQNKYWAKDYNMEETVPQYPAPQWYQSYRWTLKLLQQVG